MNARLTILNVESLEFGVLVDVCESTLADYDKQEGENSSLWRARISRTIEEMPAVYRWFLTLHARYDHSTDGAAAQFGLKHPSYKQQRQRRDLLKDMASAAKMRYEAASRAITMEASFDPEGFPTTRKV